MQNCESVNDLALKALADNCTSMDLLQITLSYGRVSHNEVTCAGYDALVQKGIEAVQIPLPEQSATCKLLLELYSVIYFMGWGRTYIYCLIGGKLPITDRAALVRSL